jgi:hypothetical protein
MIPNPGCRQTYEVTLDPLKSSENAMQPTPASRPLSIPVFGWSTIMASVIMIAVDLVSLMSYSTLDSFNLDASLLSQYVPQGAKKVMDFYSYSRIWTCYGIVFFGFALVAGIQFVRLRAWGRKALEIVCWAGLVNALVETTLSYMIWKNMQDTLSMVMRGTGGSQYSFINPLGFVTIVLGFFLWIIPSIGMVIYLRRPAIRQAVNLP